MNLDIHKDRDLIASKFFVVGQSYSAVWQFHCAKDMSKLAETENAKMRQGTRNAGWSPSHSPNLNYETRAVLRLLRERGPMTTPEIAKALQHDPKLTQNRLGGLRTKGFIKRSEDKRPFQWFAVKGSK